MNLNENTPAGRALGQPIKATDNDILTYTLVLAATGNVTTDGRFFAIDRATGQLMTKTALNFEDVAGDGPSHRRAMNTMSRLRPRTRAAYPQTHTT